MAIVDLTDWRGASDRSTRARRRQPASGLRSDRRGQPSLSRTVPTPTLEAVRRPASLADVAFASSHDESTDVLSVPGYGVSMISIQGASAGNPGPRFVGFIGSCTYRGRARGGARPPATPSDLGLFRQRNSSTTRFTTFPRYYEKALRGLFAFYGCPMGAVLL